MPAGELTHGRRRRAAAAGSRAPPRCWGSLWRGGGLRGAEDRPIVTWGCWGGRAACQGLGQSADWGWLARGVADRQVPAIGAPRNSGLRQMPALHGAAVCCGPPGSPAANPLRPQLPLPSPKPSSQPPAPAAAPAACSSLGSPPGARQRASSSHGGHLEWRSGEKGRRVGRQPKGSPFARCVDLYSLTRRLACPPGWMARDSADPSHRRAGRSALRRAPRRRLPACPLARGSLLLLTHPPPCPALCPCRSRRCSAT